MHDLRTLWAIAGAGSVCTIISAVVDILVACRVSDTPTLRPLLFAAFAMQIMAVMSIAYFASMISKWNADCRTPRIWVEPSLGAGFNTAALVLTGIAVIYYISNYHDLPEESPCLQAVGLTAWILSIILQGTFFYLMILRMRRLASTTIPRVLVTNLGMAYPSQKELVLDTQSPFYSKGTTLASRSCTPTSSRTYSLHSSTTRAASSIRSKFARHSARSSLDLPAVPATEASFLTNAFDRYDSSNVDADVRNAVVNASPTANRSGLPPIPGSRPNSPGDTLTKQEMLPTSPKFHESVHTTPEATRAGNNDHNTISSPSSPPNFSRPTSRSQHRPTVSASSIPLPLRHPRSSASMTDLIHPLFRPDSPAPPQILTSGTMVTASPLANQPITPKTLSRLRSSSDLRSRNTPAVPRKPSLSNGQWRVMPPIECSPPAGLRQRSKSVTTQKTDMPVAEHCDDTCPRTPKPEVSMGSPGPSIIEDDELPPILPGFVLSAGSRTSLVGYGKRKSVKRGSAHLS